MCKVFRCTGSDLTVNRMNDHGKPSKANDEEQTRKDTSYSPSSERETHELQHTDVEQSAASADDETTREAIDVLPGTGGPDDTGDVHDPDDATIPERVERAKRLKE